MHGAKPLQLASSGSSTEPRQHSRTASILIWGDSSWLDFCQLAGGPPRTCVTRSWTSCTPHAGRSTAVHGPEASRSVESASGHGHCGISSRLAVDITHLRGQTRRYKVFIKRPQSMPERPCHCASSLSYPSRPCERRRSILTAANTVIGFSTANSIFSLQIGQA